MTDEATLVPPVFRTCNIFPYAHPASTRRMRASAHRGLPTVGIGRSRVLEPDAPIPSDPSRREGPRNSGIAEHLRVRFRKNLPF